MTAQRPERLVFRGQEHMLFANPLEGAFNRVVPRPKFQAHNTALWRGYVGSWESRDDLLYLTDLNGVVDNKPFGLRNLFPHAPPGGVLADWCDDLLRVPLGNQLYYVHMGFGSIYEQDLFLGVRRGRVVYLETVDNRPSEQAELAVQWLPGDAPRRVVSRELTERVAEVYGPDEAGFLRAVVAAPDDPTPKLVYADWLDERSDPRGTLIRLEVGRADTELDQQRATEWDAAKERVQQAVKDWLWMKVMGFSPARSNW